MLDTEEKYVEQIKHYLHRFTLRAQIYVEPDTSIDRATKIIEQVREACGDVMLSGHFTAV